MWLLNDGIELARAIEQALVTNNLNCHCAMGGGVLHRGESKKDLDIYFYPHKSPLGYNLLHIYSVLIELGIKDIHHVPLHHLGDSKIVYAGDYNGKRVDLFFL